MNAVRPSLIRVEADEATYDLHIILRCEIEAELVAGTIEVADLPALWAQKVRDYLGLDVPSDTLGVLQDVHWSSGMLGAFPAYTLGNIMASQLFEAAERVPEVAAGIEGRGLRTAAGLAARQRAPPRQVLLAPRDASPCDRPRARNRALPLRPVAQGGLARRRLSPSDARCGGWTSHRRAGKVV